jgi:hypothetical protein
MAEARQFGEPAIHYRSNNHACGNAECCGPNMDYILCNSEMMVAEYTREGILWYAEIGIFHTNIKEEVTCASCLRVAGPNG